MDDKAKLIDEIVELHRQVNKALRRHESELWMQLNLTIAQLKSLFFISDHNGITPGKLAQALHVTPANVTGIIDRLVEQGLVTRRENPEDRRTLLLRTTDRGEAILAELRERRIAQLSSVLASLNEDELVLVAHGLALLAKAAERYSEENR